MRCLLPAYRPDLGIDVLRLAALDNPDGRRPTGIRRAARGETGEIGVPISRSRDPARCGRVGFTVGGVTVCGASQRNEDEMAVGTSPVGDGVGDV